MAYSGRRRRSTRIKDQERDGVGAEVIYGILGLSRRIQDGEAMGMIFRIYNDFAMQFRKFDPDRFAPLACLPNHDPQAGGRRAAAHRQARAYGSGVDRVGFRAADLGSRLGSWSGKRRMIPAFRSRFTIRDKMSGRQSQRSPFRRKCQSTERRAASRVSLRLGAISRLDHLLRSF